jgi:hypothetical protein
MKAAGDLPVEAGIDWERLAELRAAFLAGTAGTRDYWHSESDLASYDATLAQRIGWKWDFVLEDLARRDWSPPIGHLVDWGCGSGIAARAFLDRFGVETARTLWFADRSVMAMRFAAARAKSKYPEAAIKTGMPVSTSNVTILVSHVLTELRPAELRSLLHLLRRATSVLWVEPGTHDASRALIRVREELRVEFHPIAPCVHCEGCGLLKAGLEGHWCHHFATPPPAVFTDPFWGRFSRLMEIDLRSVPLSYVVLDRRPRPPLPDGTVRVLGRPRVGKAEVRLLACNAAGVHDLSLSRRQFPTAWQDTRKGRSASLQALPDHSQGAPAPRPIFPGTD